MGCLDGKAVVITGAGRGLGAAYAKLAAAEGASVIVNDVDAGVAESTARAIREAGGRATAHAADIAKWDAAAGLIDACEREYGAVDGLVNNAGLHHLALPEEESEAEIRAVVESNLYGTLFCGLHAIRAMEKRGRGSIVNVTSGSQTGISRMAVYGATKGAIASLTYSWSIDLKPKGLRVNAISPLALSRMIDTSNEYFLRRGEKPSSQPTVTPEQNAPLVAYLLSDLSDGLNGQVIRMDGTQIGLMSHPAVLHPPLRRESWTLSDIDAALAPLKAQQVPVGIYAVRQQVEAFTASRT